MKDFEDEIDIIRVELFEKTKEMGKEALIVNVNSHAKKVAKEFGINIKARLDEVPYQIISA